MSIQWNEREPGDDPAALERRLEKLLKINAVLMDRVERSMDQQGNAKVIRAMVPLATMFGYATEVRNQSQGRASFTMHFEHYEAVPFSVVEEILAKKATRDSEAGV